MRKFRCLICNKIFFGKDSVHRKVCSKICLNTYQSKFQVGENANNWKGGLVNKRCAICNNTFSGYPSVMRDRKVCSKECYRIYKSRFHTGKKAPNWSGGNIKKTCEICYKSFFVNKSIKDKRRFCSKECDGKYRSIYNIGEKSPRYKKGFYINARGYKVILMPNHPYCPKTGYISEHRLVMEKHIGRYLRKEEVIHHINGIRTDNRIENLKLYANHSQHMKDSHKAIGKTLQECSNCHRIMRCYSVKYMLCKTCFEHKAYL